MPLTYLLKKSALLIAAFLSPFIFFSAPGAHAQQKSIGGAYDFEDKVIWLRAHDLLDSLGMGENSRVSFWPDASHYGNHARQLEGSSLRPFFHHQSQSDENFTFNNLPVVRFAATGYQFMEIEDSEELDGMEGLTIITVMRSSRPSTSNARQGIISKYAEVDYNPNRYSWGMNLRRPFRLLLSINTDTENNSGDYSQDENKGYLLSTMFDGAERNKFFYANGHQIGSRTDRPYNRVNRNEGAPVEIGRLRRNEGTNYFLQGEIAEILVFKKALNPAQRLIVENILANKYNIDLTDNFYISDFPAIFQNDIIGIGTNDGQKKHIASLIHSGGLLIAEHFNAFSNSNEFVFAGHNNVTHTITTADIPTGVEHRWNRSWFINRSTTQGQGTSVRLTFDFVEAGLFGQMVPDKIYTLLFRQSPADEFEEIDVLASVSGGVVNFILPDDKFQTGFYTIGLTPQTFTTWVSERSGVWNDPATWQNAISPVNVQTFDNVVIKSGHDVIITDNDLECNDLQIEDGGTLLINDTRDHNFYTIRGKGNMVIEGDYFPIGNDALFNAQNGGTVIFTGDATYLFSTYRELNNVIIDLDNSSVPLTIATDYYVKGNLTIRRGSLYINDESEISRTLRVDGNMLVGETPGLQASLHTGTGNAPGGHRISVGGNMTINGISRFSNLTQPDYETTPNNGYTHVVFNNPSANQLLQVNSLAPFYRIEIDKGFDENYHLRIQASTPDLFYLFGRNGTQPQGNTPNLTNENALGLLSGTVVLGNNILIERLWTGFGVYDIDSDAHLILEGAEIGTDEVEVTSAFRIHGKFTVRDESIFRTKATYGIVLMGSGQIRIEGGLVMAERFRNSANFGVNRGSYIQTGGIFTLFPKRDISLDHLAEHYRFSLSYPDAYFGMSGGTLNIYPIRGTESIAAGGGIYIASEQNNFEISGGTVNLYIPYNADFLINSTAPFYDLNLIKEGNHTGTFRLQTYNPPSNMPFLELQPLTVNNDFTLGNGIDAAEFDFSDNLVTVYNNLTLKSSSQLTASHGTLKFAGNQTSTFIIEGNYTPELGSLHISKIQGTPGATGLVVERSGAGNQELLSIEDLLHIEKGSLLFNSENYLSLKGNLHLMDSVGNSPSAGRLLLDGAQEQSITIPAADNNSYIGHLEIANSSGVTLLENSLTGVGRLTLTQGVFFIQNLGVTIFENIEGNDFGISKMIATSGGISDIGLRRWLLADGPLYFPLGTKIESTYRFTPLEASFSDVSEEILIQLNPVASELSTLGGSPEDPALSFYWRVRHSDVPYPDLPVVDSYIFTYDPTDLPNPIPAEFVPGKIVNYEREVEDYSNFSISPATLTFDNNGLGFTLETGEYTAAHEDRFAGSVRRFFSLGSNNPQVPLSWHDHTTWSLEDHNIPDNPEQAIPGPGDLVEIGYNSATPEIGHSIIITQETSIGGLAFNSIDESSLSRLTLDAASIDVNLGAVSGRGAIVFQLGADEPAVVGDFGDFNNSTTNQIVYVSDGLDHYYLPQGITQYPTLVLQGPGTGLAPITLADEDLTITGSMIINNNARAIVSNEINGNITIQNHLIAGGNNSPGEFMLQASGQVRTVAVKGDIQVRGSSDSKIHTEEAAGSLTHLLVAEGNIIHDNGHIQLFTSSANAKTNLELGGNNNGSYVKAIGSTAVFNRIIMNKGNHSEPEFSFEDNFILGHPSDEADKSLQLVNGTLKLAHEDIDIVLTSANGSFSIPSTAGLTLEKAKANVQGTGTGIELDGRLRLGDSGRLHMHEDNSNAFIQYGSGGSARIEVTGENASMIVGSQIRGSTNNDNGIIKYNQTGGNVVVGQNTAGINTRGVFEVHNPGSTFHLSGGTLAIANGNQSGRAALYLKASVSSVENNATIVLGNSSTPVNTKLRIESANILPNIIVDGPGSLEALFENDNITINGNLIVNPGNSVYLNAPNFLIRGNLEVDQAAGFYSVNSTVHFTGNNQRISGNINFNHLKVNPSVNLILDNDIPTDITVNGNLEIVSGELIDQGNDIHLEGNLTNHAHHISWHETGGLVFSGGSTQNVYGSGTMGRMTLDNPFNVVVNNNITLEDTLVFEKGLLDIQGYRLTLRSTSGFKTDIDGFSSVRMIRTNDLFARGLRRYVEGTGTFLFPVGTGNKYTPVVLDITDNPASNPFVQISPTNNTHPSLSKSGGNLGYYWNVAGDGLVNFKGELIFHYFPTDVIGDSTLYVPARLNNEFWSLLDNTLVFLDDYYFVFPFTEFTSDIQGEYTIGNDIPEKILRFRSKENGSWSSVSTWENVTPGDASAPVPEGGPMGQIVEIRAEDQVTTQANKRNAYRAEINGTLIVDQLSAGNHYLGQVGGSGKIVVRGAALPSADYDLFAAEGTMEYTGNDSYTIDPQFFPVAGIKSLYFSGQGDRRLPPGELNIKGNLEIRDNALLDNSVHSNPISVGGDLIKHSGASFTAGNSSSARIILNGTAPQALHGDFSADNALNILQVDNASDVYITGLTEVSGKIILDAGRIFTSSTNTLRLLSSAGIEGYNAVRYINGPLQKKGNGSFIFPVGKNEMFAAIEFRRDGSMAQETILEAEYYPLSPPQQNNIEPELNRISGSEYWRLENVSAANTPQGRVRLYYEDSGFSGITDPALLLVARLDENQNQWTSQGHNDFSDSGSSGWVESELISGLGFFTFASDNSSFSNNPLPVELISFSALTEDREVLLQWITATETNNDYFTLERSKDGISFETIGYVQGAGTTSNIQYYELRDEKPWQGISYYRLKQTDFDGKYEYPGLVAVNIRIDDKAVLQIYPNPVNHGVLNIRATNLQETDKARVILTDTHGRILMSEDIFPGHSGLLQHQLTGLSSLATGIYFVTIQTRDLSLTERIVVRDWR